MKQKFLDSLSRISENLVLFDSVDLSPLGQTYGDFSEMSQVASNAGNTELSKTFSNMADMTEQLVMSEDANLTHGVELLNKLITMVSENLIVDGSRSNDIKKLFHKISQVQFSSEAQEPIDSDNEEDLSREFISSIEKDPDVSRDFVNEAGDHLDNCTPALLELEKSPDNMDCINLVFRCFHSIKGVAGFLNLDSIRKLSHHAEDLLDCIRSGKITYDREIANLLFESSDALRTMVNQLSDLMSGNAPQPLNIKLKDLKKRLKNMRDLIGNGTPENNLNRKPVEKKTQQQISSRIFAGRKEVIKVDADRLNRLIDIIGELVIAETIVQESEETRSHSNPAYLRKLNQLDKITRELQTMGMSMRMVPVKSTFNNMAKIVRGPFRISRETNQFHHVRRRYRN